ncbi:MAG: glycerol kinase [Rhodospirillaceae bacterium]|nr:glycerol kinase [Rhodospirillaceae bacterium]MBB57162.1 glycerol kinase [Rhodospirillaceae bacterium]|tara:strand:- start:62910 stop:64319 length:1410 start_codon:yes stop_codon:yes gene_type:complete
MTFLAIDQGTTSTRGLIVDEQGRTDVIFSKPHRQIYPHSQWVEHDPEELLTHILACIDLGRGRGVRAFGIANQGESCLAWDAQTGKALSPVIVWQDARTQEKIEHLRADGSEATVLQRARLPLDPYFSASKLGWILENVPAASECAGQGRLRLGTTDAFFRDRLTGDFATDLATASRTSLLNIADGVWDPDLCALFGVPIEALPRITACNGRFGDVDGLPLTASIVDQQAALYGNCVANIGDAKVTLGTGAFVLALSGDTIKSNSGGALPTVAWQEDGHSPIYALEGGVYAAAAAVNWAQGIGLFTDFDELMRFEESSMLDRGLAFVPALAGLACPYWDRTAKGSWLGLTLDTTQANMMQAVLEGIAYRVAQVLTAMDSQIPLNSSLRVDGGMSANPWFCQLLADVTGKDVLAGTETELTAIGVARLAARAMGEDIVPTFDLNKTAPRKNAAMHPDRFATACKIVQQWG